MTTATCEHITRSEALSEQELVRHNLARFVNQLTNDGADIARFFYDVFQGEYPEAKLHHRQIAAIELSAMGGHRPDDMPGAATRVAPVADAESKPKPNKKPKITIKEMINYDIGRLIRMQTNDCRDLILKLHDIINPPYVFKSANPAERKYQKATAIRPHHQVSAAQEIIKRGLGSQNPSCQLKTSLAEERMLHSRFSRDIREIFDDGLDLVPFLMDIVANPAHDRWGNLITDPFTQTHRVWAIKHMIWRGVDIPWEHITPEMIDEYLRELDEKQRLETERRAAERKAAAHAPLTPEQEANVRAMFDEMQRAMDESERKAAAKAEKKAKKAAKKADATKKAELDAAITGNGKNAKDDASNNTDAPADTGADTGAPTPPIADRGATAVANALQNHPEVDLDTALENFPETVGVPKQNLTHDLIYRAIIAEANFQKRQQKFKNLPPTDGPADGSGPRSRSP